MLIGGEGIEVHPNEVGDDVIRVKDIPIAYVTDLSAALQALADDNGNLKDQVMFLKFTLFLLSAFVLVACLILAIVLR